MPRFSASRLASSRVPDDEYGDGMVTPVTFSRPSASTAMRGHQRGVDAARQADAPRA